LHPNTDAFVDMNHAEREENHLRTNADLAWLTSLGLWNHDAENAILQVCLDTIMIDIGWELERAMEAAKGALGDPVAGSILAFGDAVLLGLGDGGGRLVLFRVGVVVVSILNGGLVRVVGSVSDTTGAVVIGADLGALLGVAGDGEGVVFGPFDVDVGLFDARELAVKFVGTLSFFDVELGIEGALGAALLTGARGSVEFLCETEEWREFVMTTWEEDGHLG